MSWAKTWVYRRHFGAPAHPPSQDLPRRTHHGLQHPVANEVSVGVVARFEVFEVEHQHAQGFAGPNRAAELLRQPLQAEPPHAVGDTHRGQI